MELSKRLEAVAELVSYPLMADIGTDHGYVPIYLYKIGKVKKAYACDVGKGPLERARLNISLYGCEDAIETRLGSGLTPLQPGEVESIVIAGMGGMLTVRILEDSPEVVRELKELVLAPQQDVDQVRRYLHTVGFSIEEERLLKEEGKLYHILRGIPKKETYEREIDYLFGRRLLEEKNQYLKEMLTEEAAKYRVVHERLLEQTSSAAKKRLPEVEEKLLRMKEALACL